jgi:general secretion pathway protein I
MTGAVAPQEGGFSLIEAMVAMAVLAIAAVGIISAAQAHIDTVRGLERRAAAQWVAENALVEAQAGLSDSGGASRDQAMLAWHWQVRRVTQSSDDPDMRQVVIEVRAPGEASPTVSLRGFVDAGTTSR